MEVTMVKAVLEMGGYSEVGEYDNSRIWRETRSGLKR